MHPSYSKLTRGLQSMIILEAKYGKPILVELSNLRNSFIMYAYVQARIITDGIFPPTLHYESENYI